MKNAGIRFDCEWHKEHAKSFTESFLAHEDARRWASLFAMKPKAWTRIPIAGFPMICIKEYCSEVVSDRRSLYEYANLNVLGDPEVALIRAGHDKNPGFDTCNLRRAIGDSELIFEGIISIDPGNLAIVVDHERRAFICFTKKGKYSSIFHINC